MINKFRPFFAPPVFEDQEKTRVAALLNTVLYSLILVLAVLYVVFLTISLVSKQALPDPSVFVISITTFIGLIVLMRLGFVSQVSLVLSFVTSGIISFSLFRSDGMLMSVSTTGYFVAIIIAGLLS